MHTTETHFFAENFSYTIYTYKIPMFAWYKELSVLLKCITCLSSLSDILNSVTLIIHLGNF